MELGYPEWILILAMLLLLFSGRKLPGFSQGLAEAIRNFQNQLHGLFGGRRFPGLSHGLEESLRSFQNQLHADWRKLALQQDREPISIWPVVLFLLALIVMPIAMSLLKSETVTGKQLIVLAAVLGSWAAVGYFCFGKGKNDE